MLLKFATTQTLPRLVMISALLNVGPEGLYEPLMDYLESLMSFPWADLSAIDPESGKAAAVKNVEDRRRACARPAIDLYPIYSSADIDSL